MSVALHFHAIIFNIHLALFCSLSWKPLSKPQKVGWRQEVRWELRAAWISTQKGLLFHSNYKEKIFRRTENEFMEKVIVYVEGKILIKSEESKLSLS